MSEKRGSWHLLTGAIIGILTGLLISMVLLPVRYTDTSPGSLSSSDKDIYRGLIARAFLVEADTPRALVRLALLADQNPAEMLIARAQNMLANNGDEQEARAMALLAAAVNQPSLRITPIPIQLSPSGLTETVTPTGQADPATVTPTRTPFATFTPRPSPTLQPTQGAPFMLVDQSDVCLEKSVASLLQVYVTDASGKPVPGVRIEISQPNGGTEYFYTGLYPEISSGYADAIMLPGIVYNLRVGESGQIVPNLIIPLCKNEKGEDFAGSIRLDFQQP